MDFDHTLWDNERQQPMEGFRDALDEFHSRGWKVIVHSCNDPVFIRKICDEHDLRVDVIWGEVGKPVAAIYIDDKGLRFTNWRDTVTQVLEIICEHPARN